MINGAGHDFLRVQYVPRNLRGVAVTEEQNANGVSGRKGASRPSHGERRASSPHLNKTAVSCVYLVQSKRERKRDREKAGLTNDYKSSRWQIAGHYYSRTFGAVGLLAGYLKPHLLRSRCVAHTTTTCPIERNEYANDVLALCLRHFWEIQRGKLSHFMIYCYNLVNCD